MRPFLSVLIVTYNAQPFIRECLQSVFQAGEKLRSEMALEWEAIVVDNASEDDTVACVRQFEGVKLIANGTNAGFAAGVNLGARQAVGEWLLLLNPDCVVDEKAFVTFAQFAQSDEANSVGIVGWQLLNPDGTLQPSGRRFPKAWEFALALLGFHRWMEGRWFSGRHFTQRQEVEEVSGAALAIRRRVFEQVGGMDEGFFLFFEELDLCQRVKAAGWRIVYLPEAKVRHYWGASVKGVPERARRAQRESALRYFRKHHGFGAFLLIWMAFGLQHLLRQLITVWKGRQQCY